jgi:hypothetical protein
MSAGVDKVSANTCQALNATTSEYRAHWHELVRTLVQMVLLKTPERRSHWQALSVEVTFNGSSESIARVSLKPEFFWDHETLGDVPMRRTLLLLDQRERATCATGTATTSTISDTSVKAVDVRFQKHGPCTACTHRQAHTSSSSSS